MNTTDNHTDLDSLLAAYTHPLAILDAIRDAATEAAAAYATEHYNHKLELLFQLTEDLMAQENYTEDDGLIEGFEPLYSAEPLPDNVILFCKSVKQNR